MSAGCRPFVRAVCRVYIRFYTRNRTHHSHSGASTRGERVRTRAVIFTCACVYRHSSGSMREMFSRCSHSSMKAANVGIIGNSSSSPASHITASHGHTYIYSTYIYIPYIYICTRNIAVNLYIYDRVQAVVSGSRRRRRR